MKKIFLIITLLLPILFFMSCSQEDTSINNNDTTELAERNVRVATAVRKDLYSGIHTTGRIEAVSYVNISPSLPLRVEKIHQREGSIVKKGDLLVEMQNVNLIQAEQNFQNIERNYQRMSGLYRNDAIDQKTYEEMRTAYEIAKSNYEYTLENTRIKAPIDGKITAISVKEGENYNSMMSPYLIRLLSLDEMKAVTYLSDRDFAKTSTGMKATIQVDVIPDKLINGRISFISTEADQFTGTFRCEIIIEDKSDHLRHNQFARIFVATDEAKDAIVIPQEAIVNSNIVYTVSNNIAHRKVVTTGISTNEEVAILSGIAEGEQVIILGNIGLSDRYPVNIID
ncbi:MAG: efflux RND transporter periplasmic adaptor subunit [Candidatus Cloacimonetes bacterium]|nr:efflux RND transporter periplasmic adaptor subunit [Candidatus Cloacimonadota bacterium]